MANNQSGGIDLGKIIGQMLVSEIEKMASRPKEEPTPQYANDEVVAKIALQDEATRKFCISTAITLMNDANSTEGMNYDWKDVITLAEKVRAYVEAGACIDSNTAWRGVPKEMDDEITLGDTP